MLKNGNTNVKEKPRMFFLSKELGRSESTEYEYKSEAEPANDS